MYLFDYHHVKKMDAQKRRRSLARYERARRLAAPVPAPPVAEVIEMAFLEECPYDERLGA